MLIVKSTDNFPDFVSYVKKEITAHIGKYAILLEQEGRNQSSSLIEVISPSLGRVTCYTQEGDFRCFVNKTINYKSLYIGEDKLFLLQEI